MVRPSVQFLKLKPEILYLSLVPHLQPVRQEVLRSQYIHLFLLTTIAFF